MFNSNYVLVDTNVPITANDITASEHKPDCVDACLSALVHIINNCIILLDLDGLIFDQYKINLSFRGQPGVGDQFFKWVFLNQGNLDSSDFVEITDLAEDYPKDAEFAAFDKDDKIFVAVAVQSKKQPSIINATDTDWLDIETALFAKYAVKVENLCRLTPK
jgi:hypothetical protein